MVFLLQTASGTKACEFLANVLSSNHFYLNIKRRKEKNGDDDAGIECLED